MDCFLAAFVAAFLGLGMGAYLERCKWRSNADASYRIESGGRLYKVEYADEEEK